MQNGAKIKEVAGREHLLRTPLTGSDLMHNTRDAGKRLSPRSSCWDIIHDSRALKKQWRVKLANCVSLW